MSLVNIKDVLTSFSPALDYLALSSGDGRIKVPVQFLFKGKIFLLFLNLFIFFRVLYRFGIQSRARSKQSLLILHLQRRLTFIPTVGKVTSLLIILA